MTLVQRRCLAGLSGVLLWLSFSNVFALNFQPWTAGIAWFALLPLCLALWRETAASAFKLGLFSGFIFYTLSLSWLTNIKPMGVAAYPAWICLALWCALFTALWAAAAAWVSRRGLPLPVIALAACWALLEFLREHLASGFPWVSLGSSQVLNPAVLPLDSITGPLGLHFSVALGNLALFALCFEQRLLLGLPRSASALAVFALLIAGVHQGRLNAVPVAGAAAVKVAIIQGGIDQDQAWTAAYRQSLMQTYVGLSESAVQEGARVLLWPESSYPGFFNEDGPEARQLKDFARKSHVDLLIGSTLVAQGGYFNAALALDSGGNTQVQAKRHLVPFGEYVPFRSSLPILDGALTQLGLSDFLAGEEGPLFHVGGLKVRPLICYESIFPALARQGNSPDLLAVITVDTWYGHSAGPSWHASQCMMRAVENGCWVARSAATGISLFATPQGQCLQAIGLDEKGYRVAQIPAGRLTFYHQHGDWLAGVLLSVLILLWGPALRRKA